MYVAGGGLFVVRKEGQERYLGALQGIFLISQQFYFKQPATYNKQLATNNRREHYRSNRILKSGK
jgi:hypothetical protein